MKRRLTIGMITALCLALLLGCASAETQMRAWVGYDGSMLSGRWYPLFVEITAGETAIQGTIQTNIPAELGMYDTLAKPVRISAGETKLFRIAVRPTASQRTFEVSLRGGEDENCSAVASVSRTVSEDALVIGVLGETDARLSDALSAIEQRDVHGELEIIEGIPLSAETFPVNEREMSAFDVLLVLDQKDSTLSEESRQALAAWQDACGILIRRSSLDPSMEASTMAAQQVFDEIKAVQTSSAGFARENSNYPYSESLNTLMLAGQSEGLYLPALALAAYVFAAGVGAYGLMKRMDRSKALWLVIPALSIAACGLVAALGMGLGLNQPMSSSVHVTHYAEDGSTDTKELAQLTYAGQERKVISTVNHAPLEKMEYYHFYEHQNMTEMLELRNVITSGDQPSIELEGKADWIVRNLVVKSSAAPQGSVMARAYMEEEGLHVEIENNTDTAIQNAVLLTEIGYALIGDLAPGASAQALLVRADDVQIDENGDPAILEAQMLPLSQSLYQMAQAASDPEGELDETFSRQTLPEEEQLRRTYMQRTLQLGAGAADQEALSCVLVGETPEIACETLIVDGKLVERSAQASILVCEASFDPVSPSGYFYYPEGIFKRLQAVMSESGVPVFGEAYESAYVYEKSEVLLGFELSGVNASDIEEIRLYADSGIDRGNEENVICIEAYDYASGVWVQLEEDGYIRIDGELAQRVVSGSGMLCLRFTGDKLADLGVRLPSIIVEGRLSAQQEGGEGA